LELSSPLFEREYFNRGGSKDDGIFPGNRLAGIGPRKSQITLQHMLQMRSGYPWEQQEGYLDEIYSTLHWIPFIKDFPLTSDPGTKFGYSNFTSHMLGIIVKAEIIGRGTWLDMVAHRVLQREEKLERSFEVLRTESGLGASGILISEVSET
jgi:hypothetical protein